MPGLCARHVLYAVNGILPPRLLSLFPPSLGILVPVFDPVGRPLDLVPLSALDARNGLLPGTNELIGSLRVQLELLPKELDLVQGEEERRRRAVPAAATAAHIRAGAGLGLGIRSGERRGGEDCSEVLVGQGNDAVLGKQLREVLRRRVG